MIKKLILGAGAATLLSGLAVGTGVVSYGRCASDWVSETAKDTIPLEWELKRARQLVSDLQPVIARNARQIAKEKIALMRLNKQVDRATTDLDKAKEDIDRLTLDLQRDEPKYRYGRKTYTSTQVRSDLAARFKRFKTRQATVDKLSQQLSARNGSLQSASERMDEMLSQKRQLEVEVENLQARLSALRLAQTSSHLNLDDSQLSHTRQLLDDIASRIDVEEEIIHVDGYTDGEIDLEEPSEENLLEEIAVYFGDDNKVQVQHVALTK